MSGDGREFFNQYQTSHMSRMTEKGGKPIRVGGQGVHPIRGGERVVEQVRLQVQAAQVCETQGSRLQPKTDETELRGKRKKKEPSMTKRTRDVEENRTHRGEELERQIGSMDRSAPNGNAAAWAETEGARDGGQRSAEEQNRVDETERQQGRPPDEWRGSATEGDACKRRRKNEGQQKAALTLGSGPLRPDPVASGSSP